MRAAVEMGEARDLDAEAALRNASNKLDERIGLPKLWPRFGGALLSRTRQHLRDVQELAGHASLATTQRYIQGDSEAKRRVVALI